MPANIQSYVGREAAWHKVGQVLNDAFTWKEACKQDPRMHFEVIKEQLRDRYNIPVDQWATFRWNFEDKEERNVHARVFLGPVGKDYEVIQHQEGFRMVDDLLGCVDGAHWETCGVLGVGEKVWGLADLKLGVHVGREDVEPYLLFTTGHDGSLSFTMKTCATRVVCQNTLNIALGEKVSGCFVIRHTSGAQAKLKDAKEVILGIQDNMDSISEALSFLSTRRITRDTYIDIVDRLFPKKAEEDGKKVRSDKDTEVLAEILKLYENNDGDVFPEFRGTAYNLLNAITEYTDHIRPGKGNGVARAESALFGPGNKFKAEALEVITLGAQNMPLMEGSALPVVTTSRSVVTTSGLLDSILDAGVGTGEGRK